jgi:hypothetical protein
MLHCGRVGEHLCVVCVQVACKPLIDKAQGLLDIEIDAGGKIVCADVRTWEAMQ